MRNLEDERDHYRDECQILQEMIKKRITNKESTKSPARKGKVSNSIIYFIEPFFTGQYNAVQ